MSEVLWTLEDFARGCGGRVVGRPSAAITGISIDTRTIGEGEAFFAIKGDARDGHDFVAAALGRGAGVAVVAEARLCEMPADGRYVVVADVLEALRALGIAARARSRAAIVAVTGSVGKTSTKEALRTVLSAQGKTHASVASYNNHWGVPLTLARMPADCAFAVFEIGMSNPGEITPLAQMVRPQVAIVTTVAPVHLAQFSGIEAIAEAKAEIFAGLEAGGAAVINGDIAEVAILERAAGAAGARVVRFGAAAGCEARIVAAELGADGSSVTADILGSRVAYTIGAPGRHVVENSLAVLAAAVLAGADLGRAAASLADVHPPKGRGERQALVVAGGEVLLIDESYNANPASMRAAIDLLGRAPIAAGGRRIAALGDMLELGPEGARLHAELAPALIAAGVDRVYLAGPLMRSLYDAVPEAMRGAWAEKAADIEAALAAALAPGDAVMIKGSNGSKMGPVVEALKTRSAAAGVGA